MNITYEIHVPPEIAARPELLKQYVAERFPTTVDPDSIQVLAHSDTGVTISFSLSVPSVNDACEQIASFYPDKTGEPPQ